MNSYSKGICIHLLLFSFVFFSSCKGQENPNVQTPIQPASETFPLPTGQFPPTDSALQIDQYVVEVFEDSKGRLWFGTMARGAAYYDGKSVSYLSMKDGLCDNTVVSIAEDHEGNMWFGTHNGASKYNGRSLTNFGIKEGLHGPGCKILVDQQGNIWAGTNHGAFRYNGRSFSDFALPNPPIKDLRYKWEAGKVWDIFEDKQGDIWFARDGYGACKYDGKAFTHFTQQDGLCSNNVSNIVEDQQGNMWFACLSSDLPKPVAEGGVCKYDGKKFTQFKDLEGLHENDIYTLYVDGGGNVWIGATGYAAYRFDGEQFTVFQATDRNDLIQNFGVQDILEDRNGALWFGFSGGLFRFNGKSFTNVTQNGPWK
jgi:ligand-binding sensor domain-containing protein